MLNFKLIERMCLVKIHSQDEYFKEIKDTIKVQSLYDHNIFFYDYDKIDSVSYFLKIFKNKLR